MKKIFAVVVTYNGEGFIEKCLSSLKESSIYINTLVIDNASPDCTLQLVKDKFKEVKLFELTENLGFGRANNIGIKHAYDNGAEHIFLLNQDVYVEKDSVEKLAKLQSENPEYGILSPLHLCGNGKRLDSNFARFIAQSHDKDDLLTDLLINKITKIIYQVDFVNAAVWMISRKCIEKVGLFNPSFVHYCEDLDFAQRVNYFGFLQGIVPDANAVHDRPQESLWVSQTLDRRFFQQKRADIIYRLSRLEISTINNLLSVLYGLILMSFPRETTLLQKFNLKITHFFYFIFKLRISLQNRKIAQKGVYCFFKIADFDKRKYLKFTN